MSKIYRRSELSNEDYHKVQDTDHFYSSSQLKDAKASIRLFHAKYIAKTIERSSSSAMDIGTYFHTAILEPDMLSKECAVYSGARKAGKQWEEFLEKNKGKLILGANDFDKASILIQGAKESKMLMALLTQGEAEMSFFTDLEGINVKCRADWIYLSKKESYIFDLKSTTGDVHDEVAIIRKIDESDYDLSASLYVDIVNKVIDDLKLPYAKVDTFYWGFATKDCPSAKAYASSEAMLKVGRAKYKKALANLKEGLSHNWNFPDTISIAEPNRWQVMDWLEEEGKQGKGKKYSNIKSQVCETELL